MPAIPAPPVAVHHGGIGYFKRADFGGVVVRVIMVLPEPLSVDGLKVQELSAGNPVQAKFTVPVKPSKAPIVAVMLPA